MFKNTLISAVLIVVSIFSVSAFAASADNASVISVANSVDSDTVLLQVSDTSFDKTKSVVSQPQVISAEKSDSVLSTEWLFLVALFWFVMLSNRRSI